VNCPVRPNNAKFGVVMPGAVQRPIQFFSDPRTVLGMDQLEPLLGQGSQVALRQSVQTAVTR
jgi:hypothetical protein